MLELSWEFFSEDIPPLSPRVAYQAAFRKKVILFFVFLILLGAFMVCAIAIGTYDLTLPKILEALLGSSLPSSQTVIWNIHLPRIVAAVISGWGLALAGVNPSL